MENWVENWVENWWKTGWKTGSSCFSRVFQVFSVFRHFFGRGGKLEALVFQWFLFQFSSFPPYLGSNNGKRCRKLLCFNSFPVFQVVFQFFSFPAEIYSENVENAEVDRFFVFFYIRFRRLR